VSAPRGLLAHLKPLLAAPDPSAGGHWVGHNPRRVSAAVERQPSWRAAGLPSRTLAWVARAKCLDCCGGQPGEVRRCLALTCPIWPFRMGTGPFRGRRGGPAEIGSRRPISDPSAENSDQGSDPIEP
jgi:hypothetical protein